jgi:hypothetical protein
MLQPCGNPEPDADVWISGGGFVCASAIQFARDAGWRAENGKEEPQLFSGREISLLTFQIIQALLMPVQAGLNGLEQFATGGQCLGQYH